MRGALDTIPGFRALNAGFRVIAGSSTFNGFAEFAHAWRAATDTPVPPPLFDKTRRDWSAGAEFRLAANTWISTGVGSQYSALEAPDRAVLFANLKWGVSSSARFASLNSQ